jgi:hypothetical protein
LSRPDLRSQVTRLRAWVAPRRAAAGVLGGLLATSLVLWGALLVATGGPRDGEMAAERTSEADLPADDSDDTGTDEGDDGAAPDPGEPPGADDDRASAEGDSASEEAEADDDGATVQDEAGAQADVVEIDLDGACRVEVEASAVDDPVATRPWRFPECEHAPLDPTDPDERWIVVVASYRGAAGAERAATERAEREGHADPQLLWSSHYPSLNADLWVVYEGPFEDRASARAAAQGLGGGAYVRLLAARGPSDEVPPGTW